MFEPAPLPPTPDLPALTVRWEGLVVAIDATTLNTFARQLIRNVHEVREVLIDPEDGRLGITVRVKKGIPVAFGTDWFVEPLVRWDREYAWQADPGIRIGIDALFWDLARPGKPQ